MKLRALGFVGALALAVTLATAGPVQADDHHGGHAGHSYSHGHYYSGHYHGSYYSHHSYAPYYGHYGHGHYYYGRYAYPYPYAYGYGYYPGPAYVPYRPYCGPRVSIGVGFAF